MLASKENAEKAIQKIGRIRAELHKGRRVKDSKDLGNMAKAIVSIEFVHDFLKAAKRKIPTEAAFTADRKRHKKPE